MIADQHFSKHTGDAASLIDDCVNSDANTERPNSSTASLATQTKQCSSASTPENSALHHKMLESKKITIRARAAVLHEGFQGCSLVLCPHNSKS